MKKKAIYASLLLACTVTSLARNPIYLDPDQPIEQRVEDALRRMTVEEKVAMTHAQSKFSSAGVPRLGIPENWMTDGPHGIRAEVLWDEWNEAKWTNDSCIAFPALTALAATWSPDMSALYGKSIGEEARYRNKNVLLGPGVNIYRTPLNGRNFEYMGEDPYLASKMVVPYIREVQKCGIAACVKHFALNNQEVRRENINVKVNDRALHEIYLPAFKAAVQDGGAWAIMGAYNQYKGQHCCHNQYLLNEILKRDWGFDGVVISDWGGVHKTNEAIRNGLDMEFGSWTNGMNWSASNAYANYYLASPYLKMITEGKIDTQELDEKVRRILRLVFRTTMSKNRPYGSFGTMEHALAGRKIAQEGIVLLKNRSSLLPIDISKVKNILVVGENAVKKMTVGGGSSALKTKYEISPLTGIETYARQQVSVRYLSGYTSVSSMNQKENIGEQLREEAVSAAKEADIVLFIGGLNKNNGQDCEGHDRTSLGLPYGQDTLISQLTAANPNTVVVIISGNAVAMPWVNNVPSIVEAWYCGTETGNALASVLFGEVNPSGKLPFTFPVLIDDNAASALGGYPGNKTDVEYKEGIFVGYRWADRQKNTKPLFPFGHGLSYTNFQYSKAIADKSVMHVNDTINVTVKVKNTGKREGQEVVQLYIRDNESSLPRPFKELKGFKKISLSPGEEKTVVFPVTLDALSFYDDQKHKWVAEPGRFEALIGSSSMDIRGRFAFELK
ncbi:MAG: glycoside hydrolase family 3 C-terminal domain-containing protein [Bacteroidota bacterium]|nr:glycoside hydrolase family 3 C-terminal domain-containing protein [Bacteroidota bacterium]